MPSIARHAMALVATAALIAAVAVVSDRDRGTEFEVASVVVADPLEVGRAYMERERGKRDIAAFRAELSQSVERAMATPPPTPVPTPEPPPVAPQRAPEAPQSAPVAIAQGSGPDLVRSVWPGPNKEEAVSVARCETGGFRNDVIYGPTRGRAGEYGLFQIHPRWHAKRWERRGWSAQEMFDPAKNAVIAWEIYSESGWGPWTCKPRRG